MSIWHPEYDAEERERRDADEWRNLYLNLLDFVLVITLFAFVGLFCFLIGFYHG